MYPPKRLTDNAVLLRKTDELKEESANARGGVGSDVHFVERKSESLRKTTYPERFTSTAEKEVVLCGLNTPRCHDRTHHI